MYRHSHRNRFRVAVSCHGSTPWATRVANEIPALCIGGPSGGGVGGLACLLLVVACLLCLAVPASAEEGQPAKVFEMPDGVQYVPGEVLVCVDPEAAPADVEASLAQADEVLAREPSPEEVTSGVVSVQVEDGAGVEDAVNSVLQSATSAVTGAQPNYVYYLAEDEPEPLVELLGLASVGVDDRIVSEQWALTSMRAFDAWGIATCEGRVAVAVIDNGFDIAHRDLEANIIAGSAYNAHAARVGDIEDMYDVSPLRANNHGTHVLGILGAVTNNGYGVAGVSYNAGIVPIKAFSDSGNVTTADLVAAFRYVLDVADDYNVRVVSMSIGMNIGNEADFPSVSDEALIRTIRTARDNGIVTVVASCNSSLNKGVVPFRAFPSDDESVVSVMDLAGEPSVAGNDPSGSYVVRRSATSNYNVAGQGGVHTTSGKNISAPGNRIYSTFMGNLFGTLSGTSMATPQVAGVLALEFATNPELSADEATSILYASAHDIGELGWDEETGYGEADAFAAVELASGGSIVDVDGLGTLAMSLALPDGGYVFDYTPKEPDVEIELRFDGASTMLVRNVDFRVEYSDNVDAGVGTATVVGMGEYEGLFVKGLRFAIAPRPLGGAQVILAAEELAWDGHALVPEVLEVIDGGMALVKGVDFAERAEYSNNVNLGTAVVTVYGAGNYTGSASATFEVMPHELDDETVIAVVGEAAYTGKACRPAIRLIQEQYDYDAEGGSMLVGTHTLVDSVEYRAVGYENDVDVGVATVTLEGMGTYAGSRTADFEIVPAELLDEDVLLADESFPYTGDAVEPVPTVAHAGVTLVEGEDYALGYENNVMAGTATLTVEGMGNYAGVIAKGFKITPHSIADRRIVIDLQDDLVYTGSALVPEVTVTYEDDEGSSVLVEGDDYALSCSNNVNAGKATARIEGLGDYAGVREEHFVIERADVGVPSVKTGFVYDGKAKVGIATGAHYKLSGTTKATNAGSYKATAALTDNKNYCWDDGTTSSKTLSWKIAPVAITSASVSKSLSYTGSALKPTPTVKAGSLTVSTSGYSAAYTNNVRVGTATVTVTGKGNFTGTKKAKFKVVAASIAKATVGTVAAQAYTGKAIKPALSVKVGGRTLAQGTDYTLSYANNLRVGTATITAKAKGNYTGTCKQTFRIVAPQVLYRVHRQTYGWETSWKKDGQTSGTTGESKRLEGIYIKLGSSFPISGGISYRTHVQTYGWEKSWAKDGKLSGTTGESKRLEAIQIKLTGQMATRYDVYYRVHAQSFGWMGWAKNGASAGTAGHAKRLEAIQIVLVPKGGKAPGSTAHAFRQK